jgi:uncharacterized protein YcnI
MSLAGRGGAAIDLNPSPSPRGRITVSAPSRSRSHRRALSRAALIIAATTTGIVLTAIPALAHITITPSSVPQGSTAVLTFHVPNEEARADTTRLDVQIPADHPIAQLLVKPVAGWTVSVRTVTLAKPLVTDDGQFTQAVSEVIWSGGRIAPGQFQDFSLSADPLPENVTQLVFKTIQTYSNGDVVRWIDVPAPGQAEPDHPAPVLALTAATAGTEGTGGTGAAAGTAASPASAAGSDATARAIGASGAAIGLLGLVLAGLSWRRARGPARTPAVTVIPEPEPQPASSAPGAPARGGPAQGAPRRKGASGRRSASRP